MNIHRNVLSLVAGALLMSALPASAQLLGGNVGSAVNGAFGGTIGRAGIYGAGSAAGGVEAASTVGAARERASQVHGRSREAGAGAAAAAGSRVASTRGAAAANVDAAQSAGVRAGRRAAQAGALTSTSAAQATTAHVSAEPSRGVASSGAGAVAAEQRLMGRDVAVQGAAGSHVNADRSAIAGSASGEATVSAN